jgi:hypothetical protein
MNQLVIYKHYVENLMVADRGMVFKLESAESKQPLLILIGQWLFLNCILFSLQRNQITKNALENICFLGRLFC